MLYCSAYRNFKFISLSCVMFNFVYTIVREQIFVMLLVDMYANAAAILYLLPTL
jgi:hypothetical protein